MKIITYLSCFGFQGGAGTAPIIYVGTTILNSTHMNFDFFLGTNVNLNRAHLNMVVYDQAQL